MLALTLVHQKLPLIDISLLQYFFTFYSDEVRQFSLLHLLVFDFAQNFVLHSCVFLAHHDRACMVVMVFLAHFRMILLALLSDGFFELHALGIVKTRS